MTDMRAVSQSLSPGDRNSDTYWYGEEPGDRRVVDDLADEVVEAGQTG